MMVRMQIQFTEQQAERLRSESARHGVSISEIVRRCYESAPPRFPDRSRAIESFGTHVPLDIGPARTLDEEIADAIYEQMIESRPA